jgi:hypothetical protein
MARTPGAWDLRCDGAALSAMLVQGREKNEGPVLTRREKGELAYGLA